MTGYINQTEIGYDPTPAEVGNALDHVLSVGQEDDFYTLSDHLRVIAKKLDQRIKDERTRARTRRNYLIPKVLKILMQGPPKEGDSKVKIA